MKHKVYLEPIPARPNSEAIPGGFYAPVAGVSMNQPIYCRVSEEEALEMSAQKAIELIQRFKGWPCRCVPPVTVTY